MSSRLLATPWPCACPDEQVSVSNDCEKIAKRKETERQRGREAERQRGRGRQREAERERETDRDKQTERHTERQRGRETDRDVSIGGETAEPALVVRAAAAVGAAALIADAAG